MTPVVTVVIPTRNRSRRVLQAIASVQRQTFSDIEIVVADDASTDDTPEALLAVTDADERVRVVRHAAPAGAPAARNSGLQERRGEFVAFLDDDDRWLPAKLERQVAFLRDRADVVLVGCHHRLLHEGTGRALDFIGPVHFEADDFRWVNIIGTASNAMVAPDRMPHPVSFDVEFPAYQDWDLYLQCIRQGPASVVPEVLCEYVVHDSAERLTNQLAKRLRGHELLLERHRAEMSPMCLAYHHARMRVLATTSKAEKARLLPQLLRDSPPVVLRALLSESVNGRIGRLRGDPGRPMRHLLKVAATTRASA